MAKQEDTVRLSNDLAHRGLRHRRGDHHRAGDVNTLALGPVPATHQSLRVTPAMAAGVTDRLWELEDIVKLSD